MKEFKVTFMSEEKNYEISFKADSLDDALINFFALPKMNDGWIPITETTHTTLVKLDSLTNIKITDVLAEKAEQDKMWGDSTKFFEEMNR